MKNLFALVFAFSLAFAPVKESKALDISTTVVVGVVVGIYVSPLAGVAASSALAGTYLVTAASKEAAIKSAQNDLNAYAATGELSLALKSSVQSIQAMDESISEAEAMDLIVEAIAE